MLHIDIGLSALRANQQALHTISNNIANANTDGYHRQRAEFVDRPSVAAGNLQLGTGVDVGSITRLTDTGAEVSLSTTTSLKAESAALLNVLREIETALLPSQGSLVASVTDFFNQIEQLAAQPSTKTLRDSVVAGANQVIQQVNHLENRLNELTRNNNIAIEQDVELVNQTARDIAEINSKIELQRNQGREPNTLLDQRDRLISQLSELVNVSATSLLTTGSPILAAGGWLVIAEQSTQLTIEAGYDGNVEVQSSSGDRVLFNGGSLGGRLEGQQSIDSIRDSLHDWVNTFVAEIDHIQATGLGQNQIVQSFRGTRSLNDPNQLLAEIETAFPVTNGSLFITITDQATNLRQTSRIDVDPETETLNDVRAKLNALTNVSANYNSNTGTVSIHAAAGYHLDFAGGVDPIPATSTLTGTSEPRLSGIPTGASNRTFSATFIGNGAIGVTSGLQVEIADSVTGHVVGVLEVGDTYVPDSELMVIDGVSLELSSGTVVNGETFEFTIVNESDETDLLTTLGLNTFFSGNAETGIKLHPRINEDSTNLAVSRTGSVGDSSNAVRFINARDLRRFADGQEHFEERLNSLTVATAFRIEVEESGLQFLESQQLQLENTRDAVSGVDPNEELLLMLEYQRAFQAASRFVTSVDESLDELFGLIR